MTVALASRIRAAALETACPGLPSAYACVAR